MIVVDASSIAKVVLQEEGWERVPLSVNAVTLDYSFVEVANAVWRVGRKLKMPTLQVSAADGC